MQETVEAMPMTTYQFEIDDDEWDNWKDTVPRSKSLDERIRELIAADTEGRVLEEREHERRNREPAKRVHTVDADREPAPDPAVVDVDAELRERLDALDFPDPQKAGFSRNDRVDLLAAVYQRLVDAEGDWVTRDELRGLMETHPAGYKSEGSWYENFIREYLPELPEVEKSGKGASGMRIRK